MGGVPRILISLVSNINLTHYLDVGKVKGYSRCMFLLICNLALDGGEELNQCPADLPTEKEVAWATERV